MKKIFLSVVILFTTIIVCNAQSGKNFQLSLGPEVGITTGDFGLTHSFGIGLNATAEYRFEPSITGTIASGFLVYSGKSAGPGIKFKALTIIPVRAGVRYYLGSNFYSAGEIGLGILTGHSSTTALGYSIGLGTKIHTGSKNLDIGVKYDAYSKSGSTLGAIVFKVALVL